MSEFATHADLREAERRVADDVTIQRKRIDEVDADLRALTIATEGLRSQLETVEGRMEAAPAEIRKALAAELDQREPTKAPGAKTLDIWLQPRVALPAGAMFLVFVIILANLTDGNSANNDEVAALVETVVVETIRRTEPDPEPAPFPPAPVPAPEPVP